MTKYVQDTIAAIDLKILFLQRTRASLESAFKDWTIEVDPAEDEKRAEQVRAAVRKQTQAAPLPTRAAGRRLELLAGNGKEQMANGKGKTPKAPEGKKVSGRANGLAEKVREALEGIKGEFDANSVGKALQWKEDPKPISNTLARFAAKGELLVKVRGVPGRPAVYVVNGPAPVKSQAAPAATTAPQAKAAPIEGKMTVAELVWEAVSDEPKPYTTREVYTTLGERFPAIKDKITQGIYHAMDQLAAMGRIERHEEEGVKGWRTLNQAKS